MNRMAKEDASEVDVLIVGAGPAGLMLANWLSRFDLKTRIVDKRGTKIYNGQADGLQCRTLEIFDSFDFGNRAWRESNHMLEICLWNPDENGKLYRSDRIPDTIPNISRFQQVVLHQGRIERFFLDSIKRHSDITVERGVLPETFQFDDSVAGDPESHPITVKLRHLTEEEATPKQHATSANGAASSDGLFRSNLTADDTEDLLAVSKLAAKANTTETVKARFMVGCDGAHSWVRRQLGYTLQGDSTDYIWGVLDIIPITDFPDIRMRCAIHSANHGSVMVIPRENKLVRLYIQLTNTEKTNGAKVDRSTINPEVILESAQRIIAPYKLSYRYCDWWTAYQIGQRVGDNFSLKERVFLVGDAVHTHSPKAGQGMNVSMQDTYNLGWKLAHVALGTTNMSVLKTYETERRKVANDLIEFDHRFSRLFSGRPARDVMDEEGINMDEFKQAFEKGNMFASGIAVDYQNSEIVAKGSGGKQDLASRPELATGIKVGMRMPSFKVLNQADARPWHMQELLKSNGRWRVVIFAGDLKKEGNLDRLNGLAGKLDDPNSFIHRYTPSDLPIDALVEVLTVHSAEREQIELSNFAQILHPYTETDGWDYWKIFVDGVSYHEGDGQAYQKYGIDVSRGCIIVLRPDQYVSWIGEVDDYASLDRFFSGFLISDRLTKGGRLRLRNHSLAYTT